MTDQTKSSPRPSLFARKGEAEPTAAVAHMSLEQLQDQPPCRSQWDECQGDGGFTDRRVRRVPDRNDQQISPPRSGLAVGRRHTPCAVAKEKPAVREETVKIWQPKTMISPLSSLIVRQRDIVTRPVSWGSEQAPLSRRRAGADSVAKPSRKFISADAPAERAVRSSSNFKPRKLRKQATVRLEIDQFLKVKALADRGGKSRQSVMAAAIAVYLNKII